MLSILSSLAVKLTVGTNPAYLDHNSTQEKRRKPVLMFSIQIRKYMKTNHQIANPIPKKDHLFIFEVIAIKGDQAKKLLRSSL